MPTALSLAIDAALLAGSLLLLRIAPGFRAWPTTDKITYAVMVAAVWPWIIARDLTHVPAWYTVTTLTVAAGAMTAFITTQIRFLRRSRAELARISEWARQHSSDQP